MLLVVWRSSRWAVYLDGPHILQPADLAFGNPLEPAEDTPGEAVTDPDVALRGWGFKPTPEDPEPGLVEALEVIKDALSKDTYAVRARIPFLACCVIHSVEMNRVYSDSAKEGEWLQLSPLW